MMDEDVVAFWRTLPKDACLRTEEVAKGIGATPHAVWGRGNTGRMSFPKPAMKAGWGRVKNKNFWRVGDVLEWIDKENAK